MEHISKYNLIIKATDSSIVIFNTFSGGIACLSNQEYHDLLTLNHLSENFDTYKKLGFIVDDEFDEKDIGGEF